MTSSNQSINMTAANDTLHAQKARIRIIGAGVGGLVTALQLNAHGFNDIEIFESANQIISLGVGINVQPHAVLVLRDLGLLPALENTGVEIKS